MTATVRLQLLAVVLITGWLIYLLGPVLTPFAAAALLAYLADPLADQLERKGLGRQNAVIVVVMTLGLLLAALLLFLVPMLERQISKFLTSLPSYVAWFRESALPWLVNKFGLDPELTRPGQLADQVAEVLKENWRTAGGVAATVVAGISKSGLALLGLLANLVLIPVLFFYFLRDWDALVKRIDVLLPRHIQPIVERLAHESDQVLGAFLRGQLSVMAALAAIYSIVLWLVGLDLALLIGLSAGLISFVPYLGTILGVGGALIASFVQFGPQDWFHPGMVLVVFAIGQMLEGMVLTPLLVGDRIGLHPVAVIFSIMAGGQLFGFLGVLLALPVAAVLMVGLRWLHERYLKSELYGAPAPCADGPVDGPPVAVASATTESPTIRPPADPVA